MKKLLRRSILLLASVLLLATAVFAGGWELEQMEPAEGYVMVKSEQYNPKENADDESWGEPTIVSTLKYEVDDENRITAIDTESVYRDEYPDGDYVISIGTSRSEYDSNGNLTLKHYQSPYDWTLDSEHVYT